MILEILRCQILKDIKTFLEHIKVYPVSLQRRIYEPIPCETAKINELAPKYKKKKKTIWQQPGYLVAGKFLSILL